MKFRFAFDTDRRENGIDRFRKSQGIVALQCSSGKIRCGANESAAPYFFHGSFRMQPWGRNFDGGMGLTKQGKWSILAMQNLDRKEVCKMKKWLVGVVNHKRILRTSAFCQG